MLIQSHFTWEYEKQVEFLHMAQQQGNISEILSLLENHSIPKK